MTQILVSRLKLAQTFHDKAHPSTVAGSGSLTKVQCNMLGFTRASFKDAQPALNTRKCWSQSVRSSKRSKMNETLKKATGAVHRHVVSLSESDTQILFEDSTSSTRSMHPYCSQFSITVENLVFLLSKGDCPDRFGFCARTGPQRFRNGKLPF